MSAAVQLDLPEAWRPLPVRSDGDRRVAQALVQRWLAEQGAPAADGRAAVGRLVREARRAAREGVAFAAVLLELLDGDPRLLVTGSLTVTFRELPGATDPVVAAEGVLVALRRAAAPSRRTAVVVGLGGDPRRAAVLLREQRPVEGADLSVSQVLWLVPGSCRLASVAVATPARPLADAFAELALAVAGSLRVQPAEVARR